MNWRDAFEERIVLWRYWHTLAGRAMAHGFARDVLDKGASQWESEFYAVMDQNERTKLAQAEPIYVDDDMIDLVQTAADSFDPEPLEYEDLFVPYGFVMFAKPLVISDIHGREMSWRAISWGPSWVAGQDYESHPPHGVHIVFYSGRGDPDGYDYDGLTENSELTRYYLTPVHAAALPFGKEPGEIHHEETRPLTPEQRVLAEKGHFEGWALIQVLWRLMLQRISTAETCRVNRKAKRRAKHAGLEESDAVTVVTLRRLRQQGESDERSVEWSHRWIVEGHWRNQWYPSLDRHRRIWISPYVKGPEDAELRVKEKAYQLVR